MSVSREKWKEQQVVCMYGDDKKEVGTPPPCCLEWSPGPPSLSYSVVFALFVLSIPPSAFLLRLQRNHENPLRRRSRSTVFPPPPSSSVSSSLYVCLSVSGLLSFFVFSVLNVSSLTVRIAECLCEGAFFPSPKLVISTQMRTKHSIVHDENDISKEKKVKDSNGRKRGKMSIESSSFSLFESSRTSSKSYCSAVTPLLPDLSQVGRSPPPREVSLAGLVGRSEMSLGNAKEEES
ncbi:hypothetical protein CSUI_006806 [Cystoisospora suis]|uniref:Transmembrane protein n=1 Tax=Cystoisospora suis TaxID=483139 RepID=A0A2C6KT74_9APIC|nr:hypothetical protein CSUI_006806 [Cystoisospora suis]